MKEEDDFKKRCKLADDLLEEFFQIGCSDRVLIAVLTKKFAEIILRAPEVKAAKFQFMKNLNTIIRMKESQSPVVESATD